MEKVYETVGEFAVRGKGILAADESTPTCTKRFTAIGVESTEDNRRDYREMLFTAPNFSDYVKGVILFEETLKQNAKDGTSIPKLLEKNGVIPGIKVDQGQVEIETGELTTKGLDGLKERFDDYKTYGARFAKWRASYKISDSTPSESAIEKNAESLAKYAKVCQECDIVPIVEPEVLIDGGHSIEQSRVATTKVLKKVFEELNNQGVDLKGIILKPSMVISGNVADNRAPPEEVAKKTLEVLKECVPADVPTINFLSGGQTPEEATIHLQLMNEQDLPWNLSFSYSRALQEPALAAWKGKEENVKSAQEEFMKRAKLNSLAAKGEYSKDLE